MVERAQDWCSRLHVCVGYVHGGLRILSSRAWILVYGFSTRISCGRTYVSCIAGLAISLSYWVSQHTSQHNTTQQNTHLLTEQAYPCSMCTWTTNTPEMRATLTQALTARTHHTPNIHQTWTSHPHPATRAPTFTSARSYPRTPHTHTHTHTHTQGHDTLTNLWTPSNKQRGTGTPPQSAPHGHRPPQTTLR